MTTKPIALGLALMGGAAVLAWRADNRRRALGLGFNLGGALGNEVDRALRATPSEES